MKGRIRPWLEILESVVEEFYSKDILERKQASAQRQDGVCPELGRSGSLSLLSARCAICDHVPFNNSGEGKGIAVDLVSE